MTRIKRKAETTPILPEKTKENTSLIEEPLSNKENQISPGLVSPEQKLGSEEADTSVTAKIIGTYIAKSTEEKPVNQSISTPSRKAIATIEPILPQTPLKRKNFDTPLKEITSTEKNNEDDSKISLDLDISKRSIELLIEGYLAKNLLQESVLNTPLPEIKLKEPLLEEENSLASPFQNHPQYTAGKKFNLEGETIDWDSSSEEDSESQNKKKKFRENSPSSGKENSQATSTSHVIVKKKRNESNTGKKKTRFPWNQEELSALEEGMALHGTKWSMILADHGPNGRLDQRLAKRSQIQIKDKARTERQARERSGRPVGIFSMACTHV